MEKRGERGKRMGCSEEESVIRPPTTTKGGGGIAPNNLPPMGGKKGIFTALGKRRGCASEPFQLKSSWGVCYT